MIRLAALLSVMCLPAFAQAPGAEDLAASEILAKALARCTAETGDQTAELTTLPGAFTWLDLDGEYEPNDLVIDFNQIYCSAMPGLWAGSGGSAVSVVLNGTVAATWSARGWRRAEFNGVSVLLISQHGSACDSFGARGCVLAVTVDEDGFAVVGGTEASTAPWD